MSPTRTVAVLARACAKVHRLAIESKITAAGFDILVARQEEWAYPDDADFLYEFLAGHSDDAARKWMERLTGATIQFMVLERADAVEKWQQLMGHSDIVDDADGDPDSSVLTDLSIDSIKRSISSSSSSSSSSLAPRLRDAYGKGLLYGSLNQEQADRQIAICAPEFATQEAVENLSMEYAVLAEGGGEEEDDQNSEDVAETVLNEELARAADDGCRVLGESAIIYNEQGQAFDKETGDQVALEEELLPETRAVKNADGVATTQPARPGQSKVFKARPIPASVAKPAIQPRLSRAAALRMGVELPSVPVRVTAAATPPNGPVGISGLPKSEVALPKSLAQPTIKPRANRASLARTTGGLPPVQPSTREEQPARQRKQVDFSNTPGHKRQSIGGNSTVVASLAQPSIAPRQNRASLARAGGGTVAATPSKVQHRTISSPSRPVLASSDSSSSTGSRVASAQRRRENVSDENVPVASAERERKPISFADAPGHRRQSLAGSFNLASLKAPTIAPRGNRASLARVSHVGSQPGTTIAPKPSVDSIDSVQDSASSSHSRPSSPQKRELPVTRDRKPVDFSATPGHKRASSSFTIASLAAPKIAPRSNLATTRRLSVGGAAGAPAVTPAGAPPTPSRPVSVIGTASRTPFRPSRPASSAGVRGVAPFGGNPHQDGQAPAVAATAARVSSRPAPLKARAHPPSAFRAVGAV